MCKFTKRLEKVTFRPFCITFKIYINFLLMHFILAFFQMLFLNFNFLIYKCWYTLSVAHDINLQSIVLV